MKTTTILSCGVLMIALSFNILAEETTMNAAQNAIKATNKSDVSFKNDILPILQDHCISCHSPGGKGTLKSGLDMTSYEKLMKGTVFGAVVLPGNSEASTFTKLLTGTNQGLKMPSGLNAEGTLDTQYIMLMRNWVKQGAKNN
jgi:hypothetical protein